MRIYKQGDWAKRGPSVERPTPVRIKVVPAPGDWCGNTKVLKYGPDEGKPCPGCRACS